MIGVHPKCSTCPLSLVCLSGRLPEDPENGACDECGFVWINELCSQVNCTVLYKYFTENCLELKFLTACPACEPFMHDPNDITFIIGVQ